MRTIKQFILFIGAGLFLLGAFSSCGEKQNQTKIKLSYQERRAIDTLYKERVQVLSPVLDSICDANFDKNLKASIDSIVSMRRAEEEKLRSRIPVTE